MLRYAILGLICYQDMSGYDIIKRFDENLNSFVYAQKSQVYNELNILHAAGLVNMRREEQTDRPSKNIYHATQKGRDALCEWLLNLDERTHFSQRLPYIAKIYFAANIPTEELVRSLKRFKDRVREHEEQLAGVYAHIREHHTGDPNFPYWEMAADFGAIQLDASMRWADACLARLAENEHVVAES